MSVPEPDYPLIAWALHPKPLNKPAACKVSPPESPAQPERPPMIAACDIRVFQFSLRRCPYNKASLPMKIAVKVKITKTRGSGFSKLSGCVVFVTAIITCPEEGGLYVEEGE